MGNDNFKTISTKLKKFEADEIEIYCKRKGVTPSKFMRDILINEIGTSIPNNVAGKNEINYNKETDTFSWSIKLDTEKNIEVIEHMAPEYLKQLNTEIENAIKERDLLLNKKKSDSVAVTTKIRGKKEGY